MANALDADYYRGFHAPLMAPMVVKTLDGPEAVKQAMDAGSVDVLAEAVPNSELPALEGQISSNKDGTTDNGYTVTKVENARNQQLLWNPNSPKRDDAALRQYVVQATAGLRTQPERRRLGPRDVGDRGPRQHAVDGVQERQRREDDCELVGLHRRGAGDGRRGR